MTEMTKLEPVKGRCGAFLDYLHHDVCENDDTTYARLLDWLAGAMRDVSGCSPVGVFVAGGDKDGAHQFFEVLDDIWVYGLGFEELLIHSPGSFGPIAFYENVETCDRSVWCVVWDEGTGWPAPEEFLKLQNADYSALRGSDEDYKRTLEAFLYELHARELKGRAA